MRNLSKLQFLLLSTVAEFSGRIGYQTIITAVQMIAKETQSDLRVNPKEVFECLESLEELGLIEAISIENGFAYAPTVEGWGFIEGK